MSSQKITIEFDIHPSFDMETESVSPEDLYEGVFLAILKLGQKGNQRFVNTPARVTVPGFDPVELYGLHQMASPAQEDFLEKAGSLIQSIEKFACQGLKGNADEANRPGARYLEALVRERFGLASALPAPFRSLEDAAA